MSRAAERANLDTPTRLLLVDGDLDRQEDALASVNERLGKMLWALIGILISTATAAILLALNLAVK